MEITQGFIQTKWHWEGPPPPPPLNAMIAPRSLSEVTATWTWVFTQGITLASCSSNIDVFMLLYKLFDWTKSSHVKMIVFIKHFNHKVVIAKMDLTAKINLHILGLYILWSISIFNFSPSVINEGTVSFVKRKRNLFLACLRWGQSCSLRCGQRGLASHYLYGCKE